MTERRLISEANEEGEEEEEEYDIDLVSESEDEDLLISRRVMQIARNADAEKEDLVPSDEDKIKQVLSLFKVNCLDRFTLFIGVLIGLLYVVFAYFCAKAIWIAIKL